MRLVTLVVLSAAAAGCSAESTVEERVTGGALPGGEFPVVRVCRAATSAFNPQEPTGTRIVPSASAETVRLNYAAGPASAGLSAECTFEGEVVTWRQLSITPATGGVELNVQRAPETATYAVDGNTVRLRQRKPDGTSTEITWTSVESGGSIDLNTSTGAN